MVEVDPRIDDPDGDRTAARRHVPCGVGAVVRSGRAGLRRAKFLALVLRRDRLTGVFIRP